MDKWFYVVIIVMILVGGAETIYTKQPCSKCIEKDAEISKLKTLIIDTQKNLNEMTKKAEKE